MLGIGDGVNSVARGLLLGKGVNSNDAAPCCGWRRERPESGTKIDAGSTRD